MPINKVHNTIDFFKHDSTLKYLYIGLHDTYSYSSYTLNIRQSLWSVVLRILRIWCRSSQWLIYPLTRLKILCILDFMDNRKIKTDSYGIIVYGFVCDLVAMSVSYLYNH